MHPLPEANSQPVEKQLWREDGALEAVEVFPTIQGEGPHAGRHAVFFRLAGCNLQCPACDTDYTSRRAWRLADELMHEVARAREGMLSNPLVVVTGGEPFRQNLVPFLALAIKRGYEVQVETNGTLAPPGHRDTDTLYHWVRDYGGVLTVVCSPKTPALARDLIPLITHLKYVVRAGEVDPHDGLPTSSLGMAGRPARPDGMYWVPPDRVYVQPCDDRDPDRNRANAQAAASACMKFGYRLSVQTHKIVGLP